MGKYTSIWDCIQYILYTTSLRIDHKIENVIFDIRVESMFFLNTHGMACYVLGEPLAVASY